MEEVSGLSSNPDELVNVIDEMEGKIATLQAQVAEEVVKAEKYKANLVVVSIFCCLVIFNCPYSWKTFGAGTIICHSSWRS